MVLSYHCSRYAYNPFSYPEDQDETKRTDEPSTWLNPRYSRQPDQVPPASAAASSSHSGKTTFSFLLFGLTLASASVFTLKTRHAMHKMSTSRALACRDAKAWRKIALDIVRTNAIAAGKIERLIGAVFAGDEHPQTVARQINHELERARKQIREQRAAFQKEGSSQSKSIFGHKDAWSDVIKPIKSSFSFGNGPKVDLFPSSLFQKSLMHRHKAKRSALSPFLSSLQMTNPAPQKAPAAKEPEPKTASPSKSVSQRSAEERWRRAAGLDTAKWKATEEEQPSSARDKKVNWVDDIDSAIRQRDNLQATHNDALKQESTTASNSVKSIKSRQFKEAREIEDFQEMKEETDWLPVSDLHIASHNHTPEEADVKNTVFDANPQAVPISFTKHSYSYPVSDQYKDLEDVFMAAWDDGYGTGPKASTERTSYTKLTHTGTRTISVSRAERGREADDVPISWTRPESTGESEIMPRTHDSHANHGPEYEAFAGEDKPSWKTDFESAARSENAYVSLDGSDHSQESHHVWSDKEAETVKFDDENDHVVPEEPKAPSRPPYNPEYELQEVREVGEAAALDGKFAQLVEENQRVKAQLAELVAELQQATRAFSEAREQANRTEQVMSDRVGELENRLGMMNVWAEGIHRRLGLEGEYAFSNDKVEPHF